MQMNLTEQDVDRLKKIVDMIDALVKRVTNVPA